MKAVKHVDRLVVLLDGGEVWSLSGRNRIGRASVSVGAGTHTLRFAYIKDERVNEGLDRAWVDNVALFSGGGMFETYDFSVSEGLDGWTAGGYGGGWGLVSEPPLRELRTPKAISGLGYSATPQTAGFSRTLTWPAAEERELLVSYFIDSEPEHDELRILVDGTVEFTASGRMKYGRARVPIASSGSHQVTIEYRKDESVDEGLDLARVLQIEMKADGQRFERVGLAGALLGGALEGWSGVGNFPSDPWYVIQGEASRVQLAPSAVLVGLDGLATATEVPPQSSLRFPVNGLSEEHSARARLMASAEAAHTVYLQLRLRKEATAAFLAGGGVRVMLDSQPWHSTLLEGCGRYSSAGIAQGQSSSQLPSGRSAVFPRGNATDTSTGAPVTPTGMTSGLDSVSTSGSHACAVRFGEVNCWGNDYYSQLGPDCADDDNRCCSPVVAGAGTNIRQVAVGGDASCVIDRSMGHVSCWGSNLDRDAWYPGGVLGDLTTVSNAEPMSVWTDDDYAIDVAMGGAHGCLVTTSGLVYCWGDNAGGQLGPGTADSNSPTPLRIPL